MQNPPYDQYINIGNVENTVSIEASLAAKIYEEKPGLYVSYCPALDLCSQGENREEAEKNIIEATELFIQSCLKRNTLNDVLTESGFCPVGAKPRKKKAGRTPAPDVATQWQIRIPAELPVMVA